MKRCATTFGISLLLTFLVLSILEPAKSVVDLLRYQPSDSVYYFVFSLIFSLAFSVPAIVSEFRKLLQENQALKEREMHFLKKENELNVIKSELLDSNKKFEALVGVDPLTGCLNRRAFYSKFGEQISQAERYNHNICCVMVDIDHFKSINDAHGHIVGDEVLKGVASIIRSHVRKSDFVCRYGGEEFCIVLPFIHDSDARRLAERIRESIDLFRYSDMDITASFGVSSMEFGCNDSQQLISAADEALYTAKATGRNRVVSYVDVEAGGVA